MSKVHVFSVYDRASGVYGQPFFSHNQQTAIRSLASEVNRRDDPTSVLSNSPSDFDLFELGQYEQDTGRFSLHENPVFLCSCFSLLSRPASIVEDN